MARQQGKNRGKNAKRAARHLAPEGSSSNAAIISNGMKATNMHSETARSYSRVTSPGVLERKEKTHGMERIVHSGRIKAARGLRPEMPQ